MDNDLTVLTADEHKAIEESVARTLSLESFFKVEPNGHTEYQLRNFLAPHKDCPTPEMKYRQYCRELWARVEAFQSAKFGIMEANVQMRIAKAKHALMLMPWWRRLVAFGAKTEHRLALAAAHEVEAVKHEYRDALLRIDLKHRVVREMKVVLNVLQGFDQTTMAGDRMKAEAAAWAKKAESIPELAAILNAPPATTGTRNGA